MIVDPRGEPTASAPDAGELVVVRGVRFASRCATHELPFVGVAHVGYVPGRHALDVEALADELERTTDRPQRQERLTTALSDWLDETVQPLGSAVVLEAEHACHAVQTAGGRGARVVTTRFRGALRPAGPLRAEFVARVRRR